MTSARRRRREQPPTDEAVAQRFAIDVAATIERRGLLHGGESCVLAVSGGPDSLALLHVMERLRERFDLRLAVAHLDHAAREGSAADADAVQAHAESLGLVCVRDVLRAPRPKHRSLEDHWRIERDAFLVRAATEIGAARVLTGHTLDDQAETVAGNLVTGAGRRGLGGMPPARWRTARPLIDRRRIETEAFCAAIGVEPRHDPSNDDPAFRRTRLRHVALPALAEVNPRVAEHLAQLADVTRDEDYLLDALAATRIHIEETAGGTACKVAELASAPPALQRRAIRLLARNEHGSLTFAQCEAIRSIALGATEPARLDLDGPLSAWREGGLLTIGRGEPADA